MSGEARAEKVIGDILPFKRPEERRAELEVELNSFRALSDSEVRTRLNDWICNSMSTWPDEIRRFDAYAKRERSPVYDALHDAYPPLPG